MKRLTLAWCCAAVAACSAAAEYAKPPADYRPTTVRASQLLPLPGPRAGLCIVGPTAPIDAREYAQLEVQGLSDEALAATLLRVWPREGVTAIAAKTWAGNPFILFSARNAGNYCVWIATVKDGAIQEAEAIVLVGAPGPTPSPAPTPGPSPGPVPPPTPTPAPEPTPANPYTPAAQWKTIVAPVASQKMGRADATALAAMYAGVAFDLRTKAPVMDIFSQVCDANGCTQRKVGVAAIATTADLRATLIERGKKLNLRGKYPGLAAAVEGVLAAGLGHDIVPLNVPAATGMMETLAWAAWETGR